MANNYTGSKTESDKIWEDIRGLDLNLFGLPNQIVESYCQVSLVEPSKLYLITKVSAVLPALEAAISNKYSVEPQMKWIVVSRKV